MARESQTDVAVLGALSIEPMSGYRIRRAIAEVFGHFWTESFGQIYPTLSRLEADGLVWARPGIRANASTYEITPAGRDRLRARLAEPVVAAPQRNALLLRVFLGANLGPEAIAELLDRAEADAEERLATFAAIRRAIADEPLAEEHGPYWLATVSAGEHAARAVVDWVRETRGLLVASVSGPSATRTD
jgi:DNA-binding PadR family transcriptional regulator